MAQKWTPTTDSWLQKIFDKTCTRPESAGEVWTFADYAFHVIPYHHARFYLTIDLSGPNYGYCDIVLLSSADGTNWVIHTELRESTVSTETGIKVMLDSRKDLGKYVLIGVRQRPTAADDTFLHIVQVWALFKKRGHLNRKRHDRGD